MGRGGDLLYHHGGGLDLANFFIEVDLIERPYMGFSYGPRRTGANIIFRGLELSDDPSWVFRSPSEGSSEGLRVERKVQKRGCG